MMIKIDKNSVKMGCVTVTDRHIAKHRTPENPLKFHKIVSEMKCIL